MIRDPDTHTLLIEGVRRFVSERLVPAEQQVEDEDDIAPDILQDMREMGLFGMTIPQAYGGMGLTTEEEVGIAFELGKTSPAFRSRVGTNNGIGSLGIVLAGSEPQRQRHLPAMASGDRIAAFALTEPDAGSDAASLKTTARPVDSGFVIQGVKRFITNAPQASVFTVFARTPASDANGHTISAFLVERDAPGLSVGPRDHKLGQRGAHTADVFFDDVPVSRDALLGQPGEGFRLAMKTLDRGRIHIAAVCVGMALRLQAEALSYALSRKQFGAPIASFQLIQAQLADSQTEIEAARALVLDAARRRDEGEDVNMLASCTKLFSSEMLGRVADRALQIHGGAGYMRDFCVERFYRDARLYRIYEGTSQIQQLVIARQLIKGHA